MTSARIGVFRTFSLFLVFLYFTRALISARSNTQLILDTHQARLLDDAGNSSNPMNRAPSVYTEALVRRAVDANTLDPKAGPTTREASVVNTVTRVNDALLELQSGRRIPGFDGLCALSNTSIADGCTLISVGRPISGYESLEWRAQMMLGEWINVFDGVHKDDDDVCATPLDCTKGNSTFVAVSLQMNLSI